MRHECKKIARIIDEFTTLFLEKNATQIDVSIQVLERKEIIKITAQPVTDIDTVIEELQKVLSYPRECEMEEYYWELAGEGGDHASELAIIGGMIDSASIDYDDEEICLELVRKQRS